MSVKEMSLYFLGGVPIQYFGLDPIDPRSSFIFSSMTFFACCKKISHICVSLDLHAFMDNVLKPKTIDESIKLVFLLIKFK